MEVIDPKLVAAIEKLTICLKNGSIVAKAGWIGTMQMAVSVQEGIRTVRRSRS